MAERRAIASGNYSNPAIWDSGLGVPGSSDIVRANGFLIVFDVSATASMFSNAPYGLAVNGGQFRVGVSGITIIGDWLHGTVTSFSVSSVNLTWTMIGDSLNAPTATNSGGGISINANGSTLYYFGNLTGYGGGSNCSSMIFQSLSGNLYFTGTATSGVQSNNHGILIVSAASAVLNGTFYNSIGGGIGTAVNGGLTCQGGGIPVTVNGGAIAVNNAIYNNFGIINTYATTAMVIDYAECSSEGNHPVAGPVKYRNTSPTFKIVKVDNSYVTLVDPSSIANYLPAAQDVRKDTVYAAGYRTGTLAVPPKAAVVVGVPTDDGLGTLNPTVDVSSLAEDLLNEIAASNNPIAERLRNVSTVQTTGAQLSAIE